MKDLIFPLLILFSGSSLGCELEQISWLVGKWQSQKEDSILYEHWEKIDGSAYRGSGGMLNQVREKEVNNIKESLMIVEMKGEIFYTNPHKHMIYSVGVEMYLGKADD